MLATLVLGIGFVFIGIYFGKKPYIIGGKALISLGVFLFLVNQPEDLSNIGMFRLLLIIIAAVATGFYALRSFYST